MDCCSGTLGRCKPFADIASGSFSRALRNLLAGLSLCLLVGFMLALASLDANARAALDLNGRSQPVALQDSGDYWISTSAGG